jgi:hypothetical protein
VQIRAKANPAPPVTVIFEAAVKSNSEGGDEGWGDGDICVRYENPATHEIQAMTDRTGVGIKMRPTRVFTIAGSLLRGASMKLYMAQNTSLQ